MALSIVADRVVFNVGFIDRSVIAVPSSMAIEISELEGLGYTTME